MKKVIKYEADLIKDFGYLDEKTIKKMLKGYTYDNELKMWFSKKAKVAYVIED